MQESLCVLPKHKGFTEHTTINTQHKPLIQQEMLESELGFTDRWGEQLFTVGPENRALVAAAEGNDWLKMGQADFFSCIPSHVTTSPFRAVLATQPFMLTKHLSNYQHDRGAPRPVTSGNFLYFKEEWHAEERGCEHVNKSPLYRLTNQLINLKKQWELL